MYTLQSLELWSWTFQAKVHYIHVHTTTTRTMVVHLLNKQHYIHVHTTKSRTMYVVVSTIGLQSLMYKQPYIHVHTTMTRTMVVDFRRSNHSSRLTTCEHVCRCLSRTYMYTLQHVCSGPPNIWSWTVCLNKQPLHTCTHYKVSNYGRGLSKQTTLPCTHYKVLNYGRGPLNKQHYIHVHVCLELWSLTF